MRWNESLVLAVASGTYWISMMIGRIVILTSTSSTKTTTMAFSLSLQMKTKTTSSPFPSPRGVRRARDRSALRRMTIVNGKDDDVEEDSLGMAMSSGGGSDVVEMEQCAITPQGYGFSAPARRVLKKKYGRAGEGYYRALSSQAVIDVMEAVSNTEGPDVALVFDEAQPESLVGIFTEKDYVDFSTRRSKEASSETENASFLVSPIGKFVTPTSSIVSVTEETTAATMINLMSASSIRHLVVFESGNGNGATTGILSTSKIAGVVSMQDVMALIQSDERLSLVNLESKFPGWSGRPMEQMREEMKSQANKEANNPQTAKQDFIRVFTAGLAATFLVLFFSKSPWVHEHASWVLTGIFVLGYIGIIFEETLGFNKGSIALLMSTGMWITYGDYFTQDVGDAAPLVATPSVLDQLSEQLAEVSDICFLLLAASTIVEVVDAYQGFKVVTNRIKTKSKKELFWVIGGLTFFLSAILNNLTVTIVMVSLLRKLVPSEKERRLFGAMVVVAANAGGVWTPIGDVTTTMLWINNQLSTIPTVLELFLPSTICLVTSLAFLVNQVEEDTSTDETGSMAGMEPPSELAPRGALVFWVGITSLLAVPVFKELTGLPPYLGMLTGLGVLWTLTDVLNLPTGEGHEGGDDESEQLRVPAALARLDTSGILFFLGILMSIGVLDKSGLLKELATFLSANLPSLDIIATVIGVASALIDNVPLVAATMGMYDLADYGTDDKLWQLIALCAGTGGSIFVIGSASGVALMGLEKVDFLWYAKNVSTGAFVGYLAGIVAYLLQYALLHGELFGGTTTLAAF